MGPSAVIPARSIWCAMPARSVWSVMPARSVWSVMPALSVWFMMPARSADPAPQMQQCSLSLCQRYCRPHHIGSIAVFTCAINEQIAKPESCVMQQVAARRHCTCAARYSGFLICLGEARWQCMHLNESMSSGSLRKRNPIDRLYPLCVRGVYG